MPANGENTRVLIVDDQVLIRVGLVALLRAAPNIEVVGEAGDGAEAVALAAATRPHVVLMDIRMPGMDGITATRRIIAAGGADPSRVLVLTTFDLDEYVYQALRAGASGFLLKEAPPERLLAAVATVAAGDMLFAPSVMRRLIEAYAPQSTDARPAPAEPQLAGLTGREQEVLRLVGTGMSNVEIAQRLVIAEGTVKTHVNRTMAKLSLTSRAQAVVYAYESGLVTPGRGPER
ncbi:response regulator [Phytohabitans aurantiacus]|uniref:DNA-binding response regulator n=1 Tax=Phytohabitans aurantiacus TaxID=3016789 RepID=A0ABQ5QRC7_9ACTN|nr:response regulator transcription factor [Phytohabitans aurantiacus]GLH96532.1 DNA-binding response regulator [Phytohabitans aurantiacus]